LTLHRALSSFELLVPSYISSGLDTSHSSGAAHDGRSILPFYDLSTGICEPSHVSLVGKTLRFSRNTMRTRLIQSAQESISWNMKLVAFTNPRESDHIVAVFRDSLRPRSRPVLVEASLIVGAEGSLSIIRSRFFSRIYRSPGVPVYLKLVFTAAIPRKLMAPLLTIDKHQFRGSHPEKGQYMSLSISPTCMVNYYAGSKLQVRIEISSLDTLSQRQVLGVSVRDPTPDIMVALAEASRGCFSDLKAVLEYAATDSATKGEVSVIDPQPEPLTTAELSKEPRITLVGNSTHGMYVGFNNLQPDCTDTPLGYRILITASIKVFSMLLLSWLAFAVIHRTSCSQLYKNTRRIWCRERNICLHAGE
jgi:hypothetical protein